MTKETKDTLLWLINKELDQEFSYQVDNIWRFGECDKALITDLIRAEKELTVNRQKGWDKFINAEIVKDDIDKYLHGLDEEMARYKKYKLENQ